MAPRTERCVGVSAGAKHRVVRGSFAALGGTVRRRGGAAIADRATCVRVSIGVRCALDGMILKRSPFGRI